MIAAAYDAFRTYVADLPGIPDIDDIARVTKDGEPVRANYVIVWPPTVPRLDDERYTARQRAVSKAAHRFDVRPVATSVAGLLAMVDALLTGLIGVTLEVDGRRCDPATLVEGVEEGHAQYDRTARLHYMDLTFEVISRPTGA